jgi:hypothetical protein
MISDTETGRPRPRSTLLALSVLTALLAFLRLHTFDEPLERDLTTYAIVAHEVLSGRALYSEVWDHKPPAVYVTYGLAEVIAGYGPRAIYLLGVTAAVATLFGVFRVASQLAGPAGGLWAATIWTLLANNHALQANQPNTEVFMNACVVWAVALLLSEGRPVWISWRFAAAGALFALASMYKPVIAAVAATACAAHVVCPGPGQRLKALAHAVAIAAIGALAWGAVMLYFSATGRLAEFQYAIFTFNGHYAGDTLANLSTMTGDAMRIVNVPAGIALVALSAIGAVIGVWRGHTRGWVMTLAALFGAHLAAVLPGKDFLHYFQLWLPWLAIGGGAGLVVAASLVRSAWRVPVTVAAGAALLLAPVREVAAGLRQSPQEISYAKYGNYFVASADLGAQIDRMLLPHETFYEWGNETGLYFYSRRRPATGVFYNIPLMSGSGKRPLRNRVLTELSSAPPELLVVVKDAMPLDERVTLLKWLSEQYVPLPAGRGRRGPFLLYVRQGSRLDSVRSLEAQSGT